MRSLGLSLRAVAAGMLLSGAIGIISLHASVAHAWLFDEVNYGGLSLGGHATYFRPEDADKGTWYGGGQARLHLGTVFALEALADYRRNNFGDTRVDTYPVQVSALAYLLPGRRLSPFILGGVGWYHTRVKGPGDLDDTQQRFGVHAGGGLQLFMNRHWSIDSTYRYVWLERVESRNTSLDDKKFEDSGHMITIGLNYHF